MPMEACDKEMSSMKQNFLFLLLLFLISGGNKLAMLALRPMKHVQSCKLSPGKTEAMKASVSSLIFGSALRGR